MTAGRPRDIDERLNQLEQLFKQAGTLTLDNRERGVRLEERLNRAEEVLVGWVERSTEQFQRIDQTLDRVVDTLDRFSERMDRLGERVDSLAASSERHDRILDYLIKRDADRANGESNGSN